MGRKLIAEYKSMKKRRAHKSPIAVCTVLCMCLFFSAAVIPVSAGVSFSEEGTGTADSIYVAGNPDFYPVEYYDEDTGRYEGMMPELLKIISEDTGLKFTYVSSGEKNQQTRLAKNGQVEMVTACLESNEKMQAYTSDRKIVCSVFIDGREQNVCVAFTKIAPDGLSERISESIDKIPESRLTAIAATQAMNNEQGHFPPWILTAVSALCVIVCIIAIALVVLLRKNAARGRQDKFLDPLTGIGNKAYFVHYFDNSISDMERELYFVAYFAFDISHFNQYYGQSESESILRFAAGVLTQNAADTDIAARITGGGFALAFQSANTDSAQERTEQLLCQLNRFGKEHNRDHEVEFCAGVYSLTRSDRSCETALFSAQQGYLYAVRNDLPFYFSSNKLLKQVEEEILMQQQITSALKNREFRLYLQFIVDKATKNIIGAETLSRWQHPRKGLLTPGHYIHTMEKLGNIRELDFYVFEEACKQLESWKSAGLGHLVLSCNFTRATISEENFADHINMIADRYSFDHSRLIIEITEDMAEENEENAFRNIKKCKKDGYKIALDDFGDGYTSFSNLYNYNLDYIKIDKNIVRQVGTPKGNALLNGMITLGHEMGMGVLCEGIETEQQNELICDTECDLIQGYYYFRAIPQEEAVKFFKSERSSD